METDFSVFALLGEREYKLYFEKQNYITFVFLNTKIFNRNLSVAVL